MGAAAREVARVRREALSACMTCPLCRGLLREATAIAECLHTFCRECIMKEIDDEDVDHCPVCNIDLGCDPEEKLRPDHNLQDIRNKIFPIKRETIASSKGATVILPAKRKQRSLSSLVVDTPRVEIKVGMTGRRTKTTRRRTASHATSPDRNGILNSSNNSEIQDQTAEKQTAPQSTKVANKKQRNTDVDAPKKPSSEDRKNDKMTDKEEKNDKLTDKEEKNDKLTDKEEKNGKMTDKEELGRPLKSYIDALSRTKSPRSSPKTRAVKEQVIKNEPVRKGDTENEVVSSGKRKRKPRLKDGNKGNSSKPASLKGKARNDDNLKEESLGAVSTSALRSAVAAPVWFSLVSLPNLKEGPQLPQLPKNYLRIKDGNMQISSVQRYIMTKLDLENADEVEITCQCEPISPSSRLQDLVGLCMRREPDQPTQASLHAPAKEFVMVLGYRRRQRVPAP